MCHVNYHWCAFVAALDERMESETLSVRGYFALLLTVIAAFAALVIATVQSDIAKSTISQQGLSVQLAANSVCSSLFGVTQESALVVTVAGHGRSTLNALRYHVHFMFLMFVALNIYRSQSVALQNSLFDKLGLVSGLTFNFPTEQATNMQLIAILKLRMQWFPAIRDILDLQGNSCR